MIINFRKTTKGNKELEPNARQNKFLLEIGAVEEFGQNFNGYGYQDKVRIYELNTAQIRQYNALGKIETKPVKKLTQEQKTENWAKRLDKLVACGIDTAREIAQEKLSYQERQIDDLEYRQADHYSTKREQLINRIRRTNPLRRIQDCEHAEAIMAASDRHNNTNYEELLDNARDFALADRGDVQEYARQNMEVLTLAC